MQEYQDIGFAKTANKHIVGAMNKLAFHCEFFIRREGGLDAVRILEGNRKINRTPSSYMNYKYPIESLHEILTGEKPPRPRLGSV